VEDRSQEQRKHIFAINGSPDFFNVIRYVFQEEDYNVTTTNFVPNSFEQIAALDPDALIVDIVVGQRAGWDLLEQTKAEAATSGILVLIVSTNPPCWSVPGAGSALRKEPLSDQAVRPRGDPDPHPGDDRGGLISRWCGAWQL
jgi:hypothetical protein